MRGSCKEACSKILEPKILHAEGTDKISEICGKSKIKGGTSMGSWCADRMTFIFTPAAHILFLLFSLRAQLGCSHDQRVQTLKHCVGTRSSSMNAARVARSTRKTNMPSC
jgi:hypothetical protein